MKTNDLVVFFRLNDVEKPVIKLVDREHQAVLAFIHMEGAHVTVHAQGKDRLVTIWDKCYWSAWSENRVAIAQNRKYRDPDKHAHYPLQRLSGPPEVPLCLLTSQASLTTRPIDTGRTSLLLTPPLRSSTRRSTSPRSTE